MAHSNMEFRISAPSTPPRLSSPPNGHATASSSSSSTTVTNSLVLTGLPPIFFHSAVLDALRDHFEAYGSLYAWAPIKSFSRVIMVYYQEEDAERAKLSSDGLIIERTSISPQVTLRVFRADPTPIIPVSTSNHESPFHLKPPAVEKNFLISPPGSPPVGWEQTVEEPPNATPLAEDLIMALRRLQISQEDMLRHQGIVEGSSVSVLIEPHEGSGVGIYVEDCDGNADEDSDMESDNGEAWFYGDIRSKTRRPVLMPLPTSRPPMKMVA